MTRLFLPVAMLALIAAFPRGASAASDKYAITAEEHAACDTDAFNLCSTVNPDEDSLLGCMRGKRDQLSPACKTVFVAGLRRRHIPF